MRDHQIGYINKIDKNTTIVASINKDSRLENPSHYKSRPDHAQYVRLPPMFIKILFQLFPIHIHKNENLNSIVG